MARQLYRTHNTRTVNGSKEINVRLKIHADAGSKMRHGKEANEFKGSYPSYRIDF